MSKQIQDQIQFQMKTFDNVFHNVIIALERLEWHLLRKDSDLDLKTTAVKTGRDMHNDQQIPPTEMLLYSELQLQCSSLFYQTKFDDPELFHKTVGYFFKDLLMWYGGRPLAVEYDDIDKFFIPILSALDRQVHDVAQIMQTVQKYVKDLRPKELSEEEKEKSVREGFEAWLRGMEIVEKNRKEFLESGKEVVFTVHERGSVEEGLDRLYRAFISLYDEPTPTLFLERLRKKYLSDMDFSPVPILLDYLFTKEQ